MKKTTETAEERTEEEQKKNHLVLKQLVPFDQNL